MQNPQYQTALKREVKKLLRSNGMEGPYYSRENQCQESCEWNGQPCFGHIVWERDEKTGFIYGWCDGRPESHGLPSDQCQSKELVLCLLGIEEMSDDEFYAREQTTEEREREVYAAHSPSEAKAILEAEQTARDIEFQKVLRAGWWKAPESKDASDAR